MDSTKTKAKTKETLGSKQKTKIIKKKTANKKTVALELRMQRYRSNYKKWKKKNFDEPVGFFPIFNSFKYAHLDEISGGALKAYVYFGIHAGNETGESWHSAETMSEFFNVDIRTIRKWIAELEERELIARIQKGYKRIANTFILPYEAPILIEEDEDDYENEDENDENENEDDEDDYENENED